MKRIALVLFVASTLGSANAQYTVLHSFNVTAGGYPSGSLTLSGKVLYGTALEGGAHDSGCIFSIDTNGSNYKDIYDFGGGGGNGDFPTPTLKLAGNRLYGMTTLGGLHDSGCVFSIDTNGTGYRDLFDFAGPNGAAPSGAVTIAGAKLFGMTIGGGASEMGVVFSMDTLGHSFKNLYAFTGGAAGAFPYGELTVIKDKLFGMSSDGAFSDGNIFSLDSNGTDYADLYDFSGTDGNAPNNLLTNVGNKFFGMTYSGGVGSEGNVFSVDTNGGGFFDILDFAGTSIPFGAFPVADVVFSNGYLYGTTFSGGSGKDSGSVFKVDTAGINYADLHDFQVTEGSGPSGNLTLVGRTLYGTTQTGGAHDAGVIFRIQDNINAGINQVKVESENVKVYPNPGNGMFTMQSSVVSGQSVEVYNVLGEKVYSNYQIAKLSNYQIDLTSQPNGVYFYRVLSETGSPIGDGKLVIEK